MNKEIKEILDTLQECVDNPLITDFYYKKEVDNRVHIKSTGCKVLLDYITNLEKLNEANYLSFIDVNARNIKAIEYIKENCITSDKWEDLGFCDFVPTGEINYKQLSKAKVKKLLNILRGDK